MGFNYNKLTADERKILWFQRKRAPRLGFMVYTRFGTGFEWVYAVGYRVGDYYLIDPKSPLGLMRVYLPDRSAIERVKGLPVHGLVFAFMPERNQLFYLSPKELKEGKKELTVTAPNGEKFKIQIPTMKFFLPGVKVEEDFFKVVNKETGMTNIFIQMVERYLRERDDLAPWWKKNLPYITLIFIVIGSAVAMYLVSGRIIDAANIMQKSANIMSGAVDKLVNHLINGSNSSPPPANW